MHRALKRFRSDVQWSYVFANGMQMVAALHDMKRDRVYGRKIDGVVEVHLIALVNSLPPPGHKRWTL